MELASNEYFPWLNKPNLPWDRKYTNFDFLKSELKRISDTSKWKQEYLRRSIGSNLSEVSYYVIPSELSGSWKENY